MANNSQGHPNVSPVGGSSTPRLNRPANWDPIGESLWGVLRKLAHFNQLSNIDFKRVFGRAGDTSFHDDRDLSANQCITIPTEKIAELGGWYSFVFRYSTHRSLFPPWSGLTYLEHDGWHRPPRTRLRTCSKCAIQGIHLAIFQEHAWISCPMHATRLSEQCQHCEHPLPPFNLALAGHGRIECEKCKAVIWEIKPSIEPELQQRRQTVFREYEAWMDRLGRQFTGDDASMRWLSGVSSPQQLKYAHACEPGPNWVEHSLANANDVRVVTHAWPHYLDLFERLGQAHRTEASEPEMSMSWNGFEAAPRLAHDLGLSVYHAANSTERWVSANLNLARAVSEGPATMASYQAATSSYGGTTAWASAKEIWLRLPWLSLIEPHEPYPDDATVVRRVHKSELWKVWHRGFWTLLPDSVREKDIQSLHQVMDWLSRLWTAEFLTHDYLRSVGLALRNLDSGWMPRRGLLAELSRASDPMDHLVMASRHGLRIVSLSCVAPVDAFIKIRGRGLGSTNSSYYKTFDLQRPIVDALSPHEDDNEAWHRNWQEIKRLWDNAA